MTKGYNKQDVIKQLKSVQGDRTQREFAAVLGVKQQFLCDVLSGNRNPGTIILDYLDLEWGFIKKSQRAA